MSGDIEKDNGDYLGYGVYADTLWNRIQAALNKDPGKPEDLGDDPLVVGIFGEWGAGKSTLLKLVQRRAEAASEQTSDAQENVLSVPVYFQPWKYEHEKHLLVPLVLHVVEAAREALKKSPTVRQQLVLLSKDAEVSAWKWGKRAHESAKTARKWFPVVKKIVGSLSVFGVSIALPDEIDDWLKDAEAVFESPEGKEKQRKASAKQLRAKKLSFVDNGFHYYELHELLAALTRPGKTTDTEDLTAQGVHAKNLRINFVIFIDDLDRCLPEKAVETLELIKTVFNLESFAFVLALDEEVVERGIGYRYKDYELQNKKPEMPITGFEYLEKIVHLPFRLPGLTNQQAKVFLWRYEQEDVAPGKPERWWLAPRPLPSGDNQGNTEDLTSLREVPPLGAEADLSSLVLSAFNGYVPRKLIRLVEVLHQVQEVALRCGRSLTVGGKSGTDVRVVTALVMIQLFQPDLYRLMRRKLQAFPLLLAAFATRSNGYQDLPDPNVSDVDLWLWVVDETAGGGNEWVRSGELATMIDGVVARIASKFHAETDRDGHPLRVDRGDQLSTREQRWRSQSVKLPLVTQLVEHRAAQRHGFDPLRLMHALAAALEKGWSAKESNDVSPAAQMNIEPYFSLLVPVEDPHWSLYFGGGGLYPSSTAPNQTVFVAGASELQVGKPNVSSSTAGNAVGSQPVRFPDRLFADLVSEQTEVQANLTGNNELEPGKVMEITAANALLLNLQEWKKTRGTPEATELLARGLRVIAPLVPRELGKAYLALVDDPEKAPFFVAGGPELFHSVEEIGRAVARAELWSALGQDDRFDTARLHLPKSRWLENTLDREPIPGFIRVPKGRFTLGANGQGFEDNPRNTNVHIKCDFYIARYPTTVDQYAHFVAAQGYGHPGGVRPVWWDTLGWLWRIGEWNSLLKDESYREHLALRKLELRGAPGNWAEQLKSGSSPVTRVNWFEARAYAKWLTLQLRSELDDLLPGHDFRLPTEAQWERAARADSNVDPGERQFPWGDDINSAHLRANIKESGIGRTCPVGMFAPNPLGLFDLSGNVWEWQNNLYKRDGSGQDLGRTKDVAHMQTSKDFDKSDRPALRGGAWMNSADMVRASIHNRNLPDFWNFDSGFRVVVSLENSVEVV